MRVHQHTPNTERGRARPRSACAACRANMCAAGTQHRICSLTWGHHHQGEHCALVDRKCDLWDLQRLQQAPGHRHRRRVCCEGPRSRLGSGAVATHAHATPGRCMVRRGRRTWEGSIKLPLNTRSVVLSPKSTTRFFFGRQFCCGRASSSTEQHAPARHVGKSRESAKETSSVGCRGHGGCHSSTAHAERLRRALTSFLRFAPKTWRYIW